MWKLAFFFLLSSHGIDALLKGGAKKAEYGDYSYTAAIYELVGDTVVQRCSGTVLEVQFILTAAYCFFESDMDLRDKIYKVLVGTNDVVRNFRFQDEIEVEQIRVPKLFFLTVDGVARLSNIAILKLRRPMNTHLPSSQNPYVKKMSLPEKYPIPARAEAVVSSFGSEWLVSKSQPFFAEEFTVRHERNGELFYARTQILNISECQKHFPIISKLITNLHVCARVITENSAEIGGACKKDAGAPLVYDGNVIGVLSDGPKNCDESVTPGIYTRISPYKEIIENSMMEIVTDPTITVINLKTTK